MPVGMIRGGVLYFVHADQVNRPESITNASKAIVWRAENLAFDRKVVTTSIGEFNIGFPGQYYDPETITWYNYWRTYDPATGRYLQNDPLGMMGCTNPASYVNGRPTDTIDPFGLLSETGTSVLCQALKAADGDTEKAHNIINKARKTTLKGDTQNQWNNPFLREIENYLYAYNMVALYDMNPDFAAAGVDFHAAVKPLRRVAHRTPVLRRVVSDTSPYSRLAHSAGQEGNLDARRGNDPKEKCDCND
jgi:RHS repeat-associated protein